jgi:TolB-like protein
MISSILKRSLLLPFFISLFYSINPVKGQDLDTRMKRLAGQLIQDLKKTISETDSVTMAVFPFLCDEKLVKKQIHIAVTSLLTSQLIHHDRIKLVERQRLQSILEEEKLGSTGAVESTTAAKIGRLLGVKWAVLGNVFQIGSSYQISAKLVDTESAEILSASIAEIPVKVFDEGAAIYMPLIPEYQTVGLYCRVGFFPSVNIKKIQPEIHSIFTISPTNIRPSEIPNIFGLGMRYYPKPMWMIDLYIMTTDFGKSEDHVIEFTTSIPVDGLDNLDFSTRLAGPGGRISLNREFPIGRILIAFAGAGYEVYELRWEEDGLNGSTSAGNTEYRLQGSHPRQTYHTPFFQIGCEWRLQTRFGIALFANYRLLKKTEQIDILIQEKNPGLPTTINSMTVYAIDLPQFSAGLSIGVYF